MGYDLFSGRDLLLVCPMSWSRPIVEQHGPSWGVSEILKVTYDGGRLYDFGGDFTRVSFTFLQLHNYAHLMFFFVEVT